MRVLVADDSDTQRTQLAGLLRRAGHEVVSVSDGTQALTALLDVNGPHLALLDWEMPGLDGIDVCRRVREAPLGIRPHLVLLTARTEKQDVVDGLKAGADDFLSKPPVPAELMARLKVGQRNVEIQLELEVRTKALEAALARLDAVNVVASRIGLSEMQPVATAEQLLEQAVKEVTKAVTVKVSGEVTRALGSLVLPSEGRWLDVVLEVTGGIERTVANASGGRDLVGDLLTMVLQRAHAALEQRKEHSLVPFPGRVVTGAMPDGARVTQGPWTMAVASQSLQRASTTFSQLGPNVVLLSGLKPASMAVEVLRAGTLLKPSHLERTKGFFKGSDAASEVEVATPSALALATHG